MRLYCGVDLHSTNSYLAVLNEQLQPVLSRRVPNRLEAVLGALEPFREQVQAIAVESTFNWYWLVDGLMEAGYQVQLVNTSAVRQYEGLKYVDDRHDARWLARLLHLGILPTGHIYPKKERALRDLLRRRAFLVRQRTASMLSVKNLFSRNTGVQVPFNELKRMTAEQVVEQYPDPHLALAITSNLAVVRVINEEIARIEKAVLKEAKLRPEFKLLESIPGIGQTLALTIMYEAGSMARFADAGHFCSLLPLRAQPTSQQWKAQGDRQCAQRQPLPVLGIHRGRALCHPFRTARQALLRAQEGQNQRVGRLADDLAQARSRLVSCPTRPNIVPV
jgi:transposase